MVNLVGEEGFSGQVVWNIIEKIMGIDGVTPHIYGKKEKQDLSERWVMLLL
jgi:5-(carboxyamino)imidazole ribonucleotide synthase